MNSILYSILLLSMSCARPNYVSEHGPQTLALKDDCSFYFKSENLCLLTKWETMPNESSFGSMALTFYENTDSSRVLSPKNNPHIVLWMSSMGHGSSPVTMEQIEDGRYRASNIFFIMPGPWDIRYQLKDGNSIVEEIIQKIII